MKFLQWIIAISLLTAWFIGYFGFHSGKNIHLLLGVAAIASSAIFSSRNGSLNEDVEP
jgi:hypothetical protein